MKSFLIAALALACVLGLATAQYGYPGYGTSTGGNSGLLMLIGLLFVLMVLFNNNNSSSSGSVTIVNATAGRR